MPLTKQYAGVWPLPQHTSNSTTGKIIKGRVSNAAMSAAEKTRIVELQRQLKIARDALTKIATGHSGNPQSTADDALYSMFPLDQKQPLQALVGHERRTR